MYKIPIKPLSNNQAWQGKRYKTKKYLQYQEDLRIYLKTLNLPRLEKKQNFWVYYRFGTNKLQDYDNSIKSFQDILCGELRIDDRYILGAFIEKEVVKKGSEFIKFEVFSSIEELLDFAKEMGNNYVDAE